MAEQPERMSFQELYNEHFRFVWRSMRRLGVPEGDVADAVQDAFLVVHRKLSEFEGRSKVTTWLFGICLRVARDRRRLAHERRRSNNDEEPLLEASDDRADVAVEVERRQGIAMIERLLEKLPDDQRAVFVLFELEGMSGEEIAESLGIPLGTVYSRLRIAREAFRLSVARLRARDQALPRVVAAGGGR
jgi:RNA polymerase sigma-70 factor (ECF subfamily)